MIKPMLPTLIEEAPIGSNWVYEVKYDGFRALLFWDEDRIELISRNGNLLNEQFPEIITYCLFVQNDFKPFFPLVLDGEITILEAPYRANFELIQHRGRLKSEPRIIEAAKQHPAHFLVFDLLTYEGSNISKKNFIERKNLLFQLFSLEHIETSIDNESKQLLQVIQYETNFDAIWRLVELHDAEGVIAKHIDSTWDAGKRTTNWYKIKNWQTGIFFITGFDKKNSYFHVGVLRDQAIFEIGLFSHGISSDERLAVLQVVENNSSEISKNFIKVEPGIVVELFYLQIYKEQLRQPAFSRFRFDVSWQDCTWELLTQRTIHLPYDIEISHPDKPLWKDKLFTKNDYIHYLANISPYMLPFLENKLLTVIRYPHGMYGESFYQKNCPDYAPGFIQTVLHEDINYIVCNNLKTLIWLGNQLSFEFHIPFQTIHSNGPSEIVFDLDPPSRKEFQLAVKAALLLKEVFDNLKLTAFVKTSGNKGLQVYLPLPENKYSYDETRKFTEFIATYLTTKEPSLFTTERLKKNRGNKLYVDYVQHAEGKTLIAPYSVRGNDGAYVATPLFWEELTTDLSIEQFPIDIILKRIQEKGCPFSTYFKTKNEQPFDPVLKFLNQS